MMVNFIKSNSIKRETFITLIGKCNHQWKSELEEV